MKTKEEILNNIGSLYKIDGMDLVNKSGCLLAMQEYDDQFKYDYSQDCKCDENTKTGETWCCNTCGLPTHIHSTPEPISQEEIEKLAKEKFPYEGSDIRMLNEAKYSRLAYIEGLKKGAELNVWKKWISVDDRLPEIKESTKFDFGYRSEYVLVLIEGSYHITEYSFLPNRHKNGWIPVNAPSQNITHWQPLPNKPSSH